MWKDLLWQVVAEKKTYGESVNSGATLSELENVRKQLQLKLNIYLPEEYEETLKFINGLEFNGFILYGIDSEFSESPPNQIVNGIIENNEIWRANESLRDYFFVGESSISWYVYDVEGKSFFELDKPSGTEVEEFSRLEDLLEKMLSECLQ